MKNTNLKKCFTASLLGIIALGGYAQVNYVEPPIMGWSSWNTYRVNINEELIKKQADAMISQGLDKVGYHFINIEAGIYSEAGANTCGSLWDGDKNGIGVGLYGFEHQDANLFFNEWGFDFIKIDYCGAGQQLDLEEQERYTEIVNAIREVCPRNISLNICRWAYPGTWVSSLARSWRISGDINPSWESVKYIIDKNLYLSAFAGNGHYNDMDMLEIGRGLKPEEEETHFGMWCIMSSPLLIGCDLTAIPASSLQLLKNKELIESSHIRKMLLCVV